ncbi:MAG: alkaline phosphatase family protein [Kiritimatiellae bacterium]|nr:alkaline phosphatase family protein [Kiritimatiellia bacterium]
MNRHELTKAAAALAVAALATAASGERRPMALMVMVDGMRADAVESGSMPNLAQLRAGRWQRGYRAAWSVEGSTAPGPAPSSAPNHASIATGVTQAEHGVISNGVAASGVISTGNYADYPTWLQRVVDARPGATALFAYTWDQDADLGPADGVEFLHGADASNAAALATRLAAADAPDATMLFLDDVDHAGHAYGFFPMSNEYKAALSTADAQIGTLLAAIAGRDTFADEDWLILVTSDHGGYDLRHGQITVGRQAHTVPLIIAGRNVAAGRIPGIPANYDVAASALAHFGIAAEGLRCVRRDLATTVDAPRSLSDGLAAYLPFDASTTANEAAASGVSPVEFNTPSNALSLAAGGAVGAKYLDIPAGSFLKLTGSDTSSLSFEDGNKSFAITLWAKMAAPGGGDPVLVANKQWSGTVKGVVIYAGYSKLPASLKHADGSNYRGVGLNAGSGGGSQTTDRLDMGPFDYEGADTWTFYAVTRSAEGVVTLYQGRNDGTLDWICDSFSGWTLASDRPFYIGSDRDGGYTHKFVGGIDDFGLWTRPLTHDEVRRIFEAGHAGSSLGDLVEAENAAATATWTGAAGTSDPFDAVNWSCEDASGNAVSGALPSLATDVTLFGGATLDLAGGQALPCASVTLSSIALPADACWRGLDYAKIATGASIDLQGHTLLLRAPNGSAVTAIAVTDTSSNAASPGEFQLEAAAGTNVANAAFSFSGNLRFGKAGAGTYVPTTSETYPGGIDVHEGTYRLAAAASCPIRVGSGATLDLYGYGIQNSVTTLAGGTVTSTRAAALTLPSSLTLTADSAITYANLSGAHDMTVPQGAVWNLGGKTLTLTLDGYDPDFYMREGETISNGTFKVVVKSTAVNSGGTGYTGWVQLANLNGRDGLNLDLGNSTLRLQNYSPNNNSSVRDFTCNPPTTGVFSKNAMAVYGTYTPPDNNCGFDLVMMDGSSIDLTGKSGVWSCKFTNTSAGGDAATAKVSFSAGATVTVILDGRSDLEALAESKGYVLTWASNAVPADSVTFAPDAATAEKFTLRRDGTGLSLRKTNLPFCMVVK